ncbi:MAG: L,D-transpeptidase family protein [Nitrospirota bacterium]
MKFILKIRHVAPYLIFFILLLVNFDSQAVASESCKGQKNAINVDTEQHRLWICQEDEKIGEFKVSIGRGGIDKRKQGDKKTPLGEYSLGKPRPSSHFGIFIPIGYPTPVQKAKGLTGSDLGIHGPYRLFKWLGRFNTWFDWTQGCIAVGTDKEISEIAKWVKEHNGSRILIK